MENVSTMSALDFPPEVNVMMMKKLSLVNLLRLYNACSEFAELRFEKSLEKAMGNITLTQLCQLYAELPTKKQQNLCFHKQVIDRLETNTFNEVVHLYMRPENEDFFSNNKILESFGNQIILVEESDMHYTSDFWSCCKILLEKIEGEIFLKLVGIDADQLWNGNEGINFRSRVKYLVTNGGYGSNIFPNLVFMYFISENSYNLVNHLIITNLHNGVDATKKMISIMKSNVLQGTKQNLVSTLPILEARIALHGYNGWFKCEHCQTGSRRLEDGVFFLSNPYTGQLVHIPKLADTFFMSRFVLREEPWPKCVYCVI